MQSETYCAFFNPSFYHNKKAIVKHSIDSDKATDNEKGKKTQKTHMINKEKINQLNSSDFFKGHEETNK